MTDYLDLALRVAEAGSVLLVFEERVGKRARFGYHQGKWTLVIEKSDGYTAKSVDREKVYDAIEESESLDLLHARHDDAWQWFINEGTTFHDMIQSHCMCGAFRCSTDLNDVERWRDTHRNNCYHNPNIQQP